MSTRVDDRNPQLPPGSQPFDPDRANHARDLPAIVAYALNLELPHVSFDGLDGVIQQSQPGYIRREYLAHILGSGATCTVSLHEPQEAISQDVPAGRLIVLKRYHEPQELQAEDQRKAHKKLHTLLWQDLRAHTHPYLKTHENIVKLLYLAWLDDSLIPVFALDFARFGTLEQFLDRNTGQITWNHCLNLTIDVATGVAALHACDYVHGDIKPSSVLLYAHEERDVVAKIADFLGAAPVQDFGTQDHIRFETEDWSAPEGYQRNDNVDWLKSDVYSLGLVVAHMWYRASNRGSCFLHHILACFHHNFSRLNSARKIELMRQLKVSYDIPSLIEHINQIDWARRAAGNRLQDPDSDKSTAMEPRSSTINRDDTSTPHQKSNVSTLDTSAELPSRNNSKREFSWRSPVVEQGMFTRGFSVYTNACQFLTRLISRIPYRDRSLLIMQPVK